MKKIIFVFISAFFLFSCSSTPQKIIEKKVIELMKNSLDDPKSYESISFTGIDTIWTHFDESPEGKDISEKYHSAVFSLKQAEMHLNSDDAKRIYPGAVFADSIVYYQDLSDSLKPIYEQKLSEFKKVPESFYIEHDFRANNKLGQKVKDRIVVYFDSDLNITGTNK